VSANPRDHPEERSLNLRRIVRFVLGKTRREERAQKAAFVERHGNLNGYALYAESVAAAYTGKRRSTFTD
jgi:hypothetical protein